MRTLTNNFARVAAAYFTIYTLYFLFRDMTDCGSQTTLRNVKENTESRKEEFAKNVQTTNETDTASSCKHCIDYRRYKTLVSPEKMYDIILLITSSHRKDAAERRQVLRSTWANNSYYLPLQVQHVFVLGLSSKCNLSSLNEEAKEYRDIVMFDFVDTYNNLTTKTLLTLSWAYKHLNTDYYLKVDDDLFVNVKGIRDVLRRKIQDRKAIVGTCLFHKEVKREKHNKYHVDRDIYAPEFWPPFCLGTYAISRDAIGAVLPVSFTTPVVKLEDVSLGLLAHAAGNISIVQINSWRGEGYKRPMCPEFLIQHLLTPLNITTAWDKCIEEKRV